MTINEEIVQLLQEYGEVELDGSYLKRFMEDKVQTVTEDGQDFIMVQDYEQFVKDDDVFTIELDCVLPNKMLVLKIKDCSAWKH